MNSTLSFKVQRTFMSLLSGFMLWRLLEIPDWSLESSPICEYVQLPKKNPCTKFQFPVLIFKVQRTLTSLLSELELWRMLEVPDWGLEFSLRYKCIQLAKKNLYTKIQLHTLSGISVSCIDF